MEFREAAPNDADQIRDVAQRSLTASYSPELDGETIDAAVRQWYAEDTVYEALADPETVFLVALEDGAIAGFARAVVVDRRHPTGEIHWLHVDPDHRGRHLGSDLLERTEAALQERGAERLAGLVLAVNEDGVAFYERHGYQRVAERSVRIGTETFTEYEFERLPPVEEPLPETVTAPDGTPLYLDETEQERGSAAAFYPVYRGEGREQRYGWYCANCESVDAAMDTMGRIRCNSCGNTRSPSRWDAAYL